MSSNLTQIHAARPLTGVDVADGDLFYVTDVSESTAANKDKGITRAELRKALKLPRVLYSSTTAVGNVGTGEDDLISQSIAAATLSTDGDRLRITAVFKMASNTNVKRVRAHFGGTTVYDSGATGSHSNLSLVVQLIITRTAAAAQNAASWAALSDQNAATAPSFGGLFSNPAETLANAVTFKFTGEATANDDIIQKEMLIEFLPAP